MLLLCQHKAIRLRPQGATRGSCDFCKMNIRLPMDSLRIVRILQRQGILFSVGVGASKGFGIYALSALGSRL